MEALAEALSALVEVFAELAMAVAELLAALLELLLELLFVLITQGYKAARERYGRRKAERRAARQAAQQNREERDTNSAGAGRLIATAVVLLVIATAGLAFYIPHRLRQQRIEETQIQLATLADDVSQQVTGDVQPLPESGRLADRDAWSRQIELSLQEGVLGTQIVVRSDGPDGQSGTLDDLKADRYIPHSVQDVTGDIARRGLDKLKDKVAGFLPGQDDSDEKSGELHRSLNR